MGAMHESRRGSPRQQNRKLPRSKRAEPAGGSDDLTAQRLVVALPGAYGSVRDTFEQLVPAVDHLGFTDARSRQQRLIAAQMNAPHGFMRFYRGDVAASHSDGPVRQGITEYLIGNYAVTTFMLPSDPAVTLRTHLHVLLYLHDADVTQLAVDQPSLSLQDHPMAAIGHRLDACLAHLISLLGGKIPPPLGASVGDFYNVRVRPDGGAGAS